MLLWSASKRRLAAVDHISRTIVRVNGLGLLMSINVCSVELSKGLRKISQKVPSSRAIFLLKVSTSAFYYDTMQNGNLNKVNSHKIGTQRSLLRGGFKDLCKRSRSLVDSSIVEWGGSIIMITDRMIISSVCSADGCFMGNTRTVPTVPLALLPPERSYNMDLYFAWIYSPVSIF